MAVRHRGHFVRELISGLFDRVPEQRLAVPVQSRLWRHWGISRKFPSSFLYPRCLISRNRLLRWEISKAVRRRAIARTEGPVILAGYAYAGAVIASGERRVLKAPVRIAAPAPDEGETIAQVLYRDDKHSLSWGLPKC